jgi:PAS domain S-box-containing protein
MESFELSRFVDALPVVAWIAQADGGAEVVNRRWCEYTGCSAQEARGDGWLSAIHPNDLEKVRERWRGLLASGQAGEIEARLRRSDGRYRWFHFSASPMAEDSGRIVGWCGICTDVDDVKRSANDNLKLIIDTTPALIWSAGPDGLTDSVNQHFLDYVGRTWEQLRGPGWGSELHPDDLGALTATWNALRASGTAGQTEARLRRHDGEYRWFLLRVNPLRDESGNIVKWYGVNTDIEDLKRAEAELLRRAALLHQGEAISETGSFLWRVESNEFGWSDQLYRVFEFESGTTVTLEAIAARVHPEDLPLLDEMVRQAQAGRDFEFEHRLLMPNGSVKYLHLVGHATRDQEGRLEYVGASQNVTDRRMAEQTLGKVRSELAHVARVSSLGALAASIAHEVNQPLSGIITNANTCVRMLNAEPPNIDGARETARRTIRDGNRASEVITHLRALFAKKTEPIDAVDLNEAAREVVALSMSELQRGGIAVRQEFAEGLPPAVGDRVQLQQVMLNLILNASDAMRGIDDRPRNLLVTTGRESAGAVRVSMRDSGVGIDPRNAEKLFDSFYTTKSHGMGVGLSISRSIIESHNGRLWASANDGPGATFSFSIPTAETNTKV